MKRQTCRTRILMVLIAFLLIPATKQSAASVYDTIYLERYNPYDTAGVCSNADTIVVVPMEGMAEVAWFVMPNDTIYQDTLYLPGDFIGAISCFSYISPGYNFIYIHSVSLTSENKEVLCGEPAILSYFTNHSGEASYSWSPETGLDDPHSPNPAASVNQPTTYTLTMETPGGCSVSTSMEVKLKPMGGIPICIISVDTTNKNTIYWEKPVSSVIDSFIIYKETNVTDVYQKLGTTKYSDYGMFADLTSFPDVQSNKYMLSLKDVCHLESNKSLPHKTMHLSINAGQNGSWNLIWEPYEGFTVSTYNIYRGTNPKNLELIGTTSGNSTQYSDLEPPSTVFYQVEVISPNTCNLYIPQLKQEMSEKTGGVISSRSNIVYEFPTVVKPLQDKQLISVYPNPASERLYIELSQSIESGSIEIIDLDGKVLLRSPVTSARTEINISGLKSGFYTVRITTASGKQVFKFLKE
jgi:hypothetical protein